MAVVTADEIKAAEALADEAKALYDAVEAEANRHPGPLTEDMAGRLVRLSMHAQRASVRVTQLQAAMELHRTELDARAVRETAGERKISTAAKELRASAQRVQDTVAAAESALVAAIGAVNTHDQLVRKHRATIGALQLADTPERLDGEPHTTTASGQAVRVRGVWYRPVDAASVFMRSVWRVAHAEWGMSHGLVLRLNALTVLHRGKIEREGLLSSVPPLKQVEQAPRLKVERPARDTLVVGETGKQSYLQQADADKVSNLAKSGEWRPS